MRKSLSAFFFTALAAALLGFSGLIGTILHEESNNYSEISVWSR